ncbi:MAG: pitrilysin family protein [Bacteroidales bacterium]
MELNRSIAPGVQQVREIKPLEYSAYELINGSRVYYITDGTSNLFSVVVRCYGGILASEKPLQSEIAARMLLEGTFKKKAEELFELFDYYGANFVPVAGNDFLSVKVEGLKKDFKPLMEILGELIGESVYPEKEFKLIKNRMYAQYKTNIRRKAYQAQNEMNSLLFEDHPYGHKVDETAFEEINLEDLRSYYHAHIKERFSRIFVSGFSREEAEIILNDTLGKLPLKISGEINHSRASLFKNQRKVLHVNYDDALQSAIRLSWKAVNRNHQDFMDLKVLNTILGGYFGSRLMKNLREEKGLTYGIGSALSSNLHTGIWNLATEVSAGHTQKALEEIYKEINKLKTTLVEEDELALVKHFLAGKIIRSLEKDLDRLKVFIELSDHNLPEYYYSDFLEAIWRIDAGRIRELANQYMLFDDISEVVVGKV